MSALRERGGERPGFPEETQPSGHDALPSPTSTPEDTGARRGATRLNSASTPSPVAGSSSQSAVDAAFLVKGFGIPPAKASNLVGGGDSPAVPSVTEGEARRLLAEDDPLAGVPTPKEPTTLTADSDEGRLKPVLHQPMRRTNTL